MYPYQLLFRQIWFKIFFSLAMPIAIVWSHPFSRLWKICLPKAELKCKWETVEYTGTTEIKIQPKRRVLDFVDDCIANSEGRDLSTQFLQLQEKQLIDSQEHFERYSNVLTVFGFNSAKCYALLIKSFLLPIDETEQDIEPTVT